MVTSVQESSHCVLHDSLGFIVLTLVLEHDGCGDVWWQRKVEGYRVITWWKWSIESEAICLELDEFGALLLLMTVITVLYPEAALLLANHLNIKMARVHFSLQSEVDLSEHLVSGVVVRSIGFDVKVASFKAQIGRAHV